MPSSARAAPLAKKVKSLGAECVALGLCVIAGTQRGLCDTLVLSGIPMYGTINSLNVSNAAAVVLFEAAKQRHADASAKKGV